MDAAWVGIAGVAGTLLGTLGASGIGYRQLKVQLSEQRAEAQRNRVFESTKDLRHERRAAYAEFLADVHRSRELLTRLETSGLPPYELDDAIKHETETLRKKVYELTIFGPPEVSEAAREIVGTFARLTEPHDPAAPTFAVEVQERLARYVAAAGNAVEGYGHQESSSSASITAYTGQSANG